MKKTLLFFCGLLLPVLSLFAQDEPPPKDTLEIAYGKDNEVELARFNTSKAISRRFQNVPAVMAAVLKMRTGSDELRLIKENRDATGMAHSLYQQYYRGVIVEEGQYRAHGFTSLEVMNGRFIRINNLSTAPAITATGALQYALQQVGASRYIWEDSLSQRFYHGIGQDSIVQPPDGRLVIVLGTESEAQIPELAWKFRIRSIEPDLHEDVYISASTGRLIKRLSLRCYSNTPGTVVTKYTGTQPIVGDSYLGQYRLYETRTSNNVINHTWDIGNTTNVANRVEFTDNNNTWALGEHPGDDIAYDAHWGAEAVIDYFKNVWNRNSIDGAGGAVTSYTHYGTSYANAFFDKPSFSQFYGDGGTVCGDFLLPLTTLDAVAHEMTHGLAYAELNLPYEKESGAIDEGLADIWSEIIQRWKAPSKPFWLIMEDNQLFYTGTTGFRSMANPSLSACPQPDTYLGTNWIATTCTPALGNDYCGVHNNAGVLSYWFYLLTQGGSGTNDLGNSYNVTGIGITDAAAIIYKMETEYMISASTFSNLRTAAIQAATALFGATSCQTISVTNAFYAVGVGVPFNTSAFGISGSTKMCTSGTFTSNGPATTWSVSPASGIVTMSASGNTVTLTRVADGTVTLTGTVSGCSVPSTIITKTIQVGLASATINGATPVISGGLYQYNVICPVAHTTSWTLPNLGWSIQSGGFSDNLRAYAGSTGGTMKANLTGCGSTRQLQFTVTIGPGGPDPLRMAPKDSTKLTIDKSVDEKNPAGIAIYPVPTTGTVYVTCKKAISEISIYNTKGILLSVKFYGVPGQTKDKFDLGRQYAPGTYLFRIKDQNGEVTTKKVTLLR